MDFNLILFSWNANGISNKKAPLVHFLTDKNVDIILLNETKLTDRDKLKIRGYDMIRKDRPDNEQGGGVAILIRHNVPYEFISCK